METYDIGDSPTVTTTFRTAAGAVGDPGAVVGLIRYPDGTEAQLSTPTNPSVGVYVWTVPTLTDAGVYVIRAKGTSVVVAADEESFAVRRTASSTGFLTGAAGLLSEAVGWWDARYSVRRLGKLGNLGTGGIALDAQFGSTTGADTNDPADLAWSGENYVWLPGVAGNNLAVPDSAALDITGDIEIVARVGTTVAPGSFAGLVAKWFPTQLSWWFGLNSTNNLILFGSPDGSAASSADSTVAITSGPQWLKVTRRLSDGRVQFFTGTDGAAEPSTWVQVGTDRTLYAGVAFHSGTSVGSVGSSSDGPFPVEALIRRVIVRDGIDGTTVLDINTSTDITDSAATNFTATTGQTVTVNRSTSGRKTALVTRPVLVFGTDDYLEVPDNALLDFAAADSFTVGAIYRQWGSQVNSVVLGKHNVGIPYWMIWEPSGLTPQFQFGDGSNSAGASAPAQTSGEVAVVVGVRDIATDNATSYMDNTAGTPTTDTTTTTLANSVAFRIGATLNGSFKDMEFLAAFVARRVLTPAEIAQIVTFYGGT